MKLFDIFGTLGIDTTQFETDIRAAQTEAKQLESDIEQIDSVPIDFDRARREFERDFERMEDAAEDLNEEIRRVGRTARDVDAGGFADGVSRKSAIASGALLGLADAGKELLRETIEAIADFVGKSLEFVAKSESSAGEILRASNKEWEYTERVMMTRVGEFFTPLVVSIRNLADAILGVSDIDKVQFAAKELSEYKYENLQQAKENLRSMYGTFQLIASDPEGLPKIDEMLEGLLSQEKHWAEYIQVMNDLQKKGIAPELLTMFADGTVQGLAYMRALNNASEDELNSILLAYSQVQKLRDEAAEGISEAQLTVDDTVAQMTDTLAGLVMGASSDDLYMINYDRGMAIANGLAAAYPNIAAQVAQINAILANTGTWLRSPDYEFKYNSLPTKPQIQFDDPISQKLRDLGEIPGNAKGLNYVPYNDYLTRLHVGEAVLTRQQADQWRTTQGDGFDMAAFAEMLTENLNNSLSGVRVAMDGRTVGQLVSGTVSREIGRNSLRRLSRA